MKVAIVGASGAVGREILNILEPASLPIDEILLYGSERSEGKSLPFRGKSVAIRRLSPEASFSGVDFALVSAGASVSRQYADLITAHGTVMIDNSSAFRMDADVPLVVPEVNGEDARRAPRRIIANPNCTTIQMVVALNPINRISPVRTVHVATYQAASGAGAAAMAELTDQHAALAAGNAPRVERFAHQLAFNVIPHIDIFTENDYTREEMKMFNETRKILHSPDIRVSATCVRVPVLRAHSEAIWLTTEQPVSLARARQAFQNAPGIVFLDAPDRLDYPMPLHVAGKDPVYVGRLRQDLASDGLTFWCVSDQLRKGAALNAVAIMQSLLA